MHYGNSDLCRKYWGASFWYWRAPFCYPYASAADRFCLKSIDCDLVVHRGDGMRRDAASTLHDDMPPRGEVVSGMAQQHRPELSRW